MNFRKHFIKRSGKSAILTLEAKRAYYGRLLDSGRVYIFHTDDVTVVTPGSDPFRPLTDSELDQCAFIVQQLDTAIEHLNLIKDDL